MQSIHALNGTRNGRTPARSCSLLFGAALLLTASCRGKPQETAVGTTGQRLTGGDWPAEHLVVTNSVHLDQGARFEGDVAVTKRSTGSVLAQNAELTLSQDARLTGNATADTLYLGDRSKITGNAQYNAKSGSGTIGGTASTPLTLPLSLGLPTLPSISAGSQGITLASSEVRTLPAGSYAAVLLNQGNGAARTTLLLSGGAYAFSSVTLATDARVECQSACEGRRARQGGRSVLHRSHRWRRAGARQRAGAGEGQ